ncbi:MAG: ABC transporter ATP-binding protein [Bacillales bacterium]|nr:ABC transporter ATP-binding protein [Bacillales bacterium]MDY6003556.1 ABC transporter ATP-binding protein [Bacilli bacterium]
MNNEEIMRLHGDVKIPFKKMVKNIWKYLKPETLSFILGLLLIFINVVLDIILPSFIGGVTDNLVNAKEGEVITIAKLFTIDNSEISLTIIIGLTIGYVLITIINQIFIYFESMILQKAGQRIIYRIRMEVYEHIENMSINQFNEMPVGSLVTRVTNYTQELSQLFTDVLVNILRNTLTIIGTYAIMFTISYQLSLMMLIFLVIVFVVSFFFSKEVSKIFRKDRKQVSNLNTFLNENLSGMKIIQIFKKEKQKEKEFIEKNNALLKTRYNVVVAFTLYRPFIAFLQVVAMAVVFYFGIKFSLTCGMIVSFYLYISKFFQPIQNLADQVNQLQRAFTACERLFNLLDVSPEVLDEEDAIDVENFKGKIEFKNVWFAYDKDNWVLKDVSFVVYPKQTVAFVGATGAGKTTILGLIVRNHEIQRGQILIDDIDIKHIKIKSLRKAIGQMLQDVFLFSGSIKSNITLNDDSFSDEEIASVSDYVNASSFINKLENKYDSEVIEKGENFSSGQRQLLSFARTVIHKPQILILDEATANIDTETEVLIQDSLAKIKNIGTMLVVAHRLSTIQHSDCIIVLQNGKIIEKGTHQQLLSQKGYYYKLYQLQFEKK